MNKIVLVAVVVVAGVVVFVSGARAEGIKEGKWNMTIVTKMGGAASEDYTAAMKDMENMSAEEKAMMEKMMGGVKMNAGGEGITTTVTKCVTSSDPVPEMPQEKDCQMTHSMNGDTVHFETVCPDGKSTGDVTYMDDSMKGTIKSQQTEDGKMTDVTIEISGVYVGPCSD